MVGTLIAVTAELIASYIIEAAAGYPLWDYTGYFMNFDGRIALEPGLMFGLLIWLVIAGNAITASACQMLSSSNKNFFSFIET